MIIEELKKLCRRGPFNSIVLFADKNEEAATFFENRRFYKEDWQTFFGRTELEFNWDYADFRVWRPANDEKKPPGKARPEFDDDYRPSSSFCVVPKVLPRMYDGRNTTEHAREVFKQFQAFDTVHTTLFSRIHGILLMYASNSKKNINDYTVKELMNLVDEELKKELDNIGHNKIFKMLPSIKKFLQEHQTGSSSPQVSLAPRYLALSEEAMRQALPHSNAQLLSSTSQ